MTSPRGFGITTATPLQRAVFRLVEGRSLGELYDHPHVLAAMGDVRTLVGIRPRRITFVAGIRTIKSMVAAGIALQSTQGANCQGLATGETPRFPVVSTAKDNANVIYRDHLLGVVLKSEELKAFLLKEPTADTAVFRHPTGRPIEIKVVAGARAGATLVARWLVGCVFDEAPRMCGVEDGVVNLEHMSSAIAGRMRPGAQEFRIGSPWAPTGPVYQDVQERERAPGPDLVVVRARADWLNPFWWTPERMAELRERDPDAYKTDVEAEFVDAEEALIGQVVVEACTGDYEHIPYEPGHDYSAAMDPATRGNAWTLVVADRYKGKKRIVFAKQWVGSKSRPLRPSEVLEEASNVLQGEDGTGGFRLDWVYSDQWAADALKDIAHDCGLTLVEEPWTSKKIWDAYMALRDGMTDGSVEICRNRQLTQDLRMVRKRVTPNGMSIHLPKTADGRHCDYAPAVARVLNRWFAEEKEPRPAPGPELANMEALERMRNAQRAFDEAQNREWWEG